MKHSFFRLWGKIKRLKSIILWAMSALLPLLISCAALRLQPAVGTSPVIRVGIVPRADEICFQPDNSMRILTRDADKTYRSKSKEEWRVRVQPGSVTPPQVTLLLGTYAAKAEAKKMALSFEQEKISVRIVESDNQLNLGGRVIAGKSQYMLYVADQFPSLEDAERYRQANPLLQNARPLQNTREVAGTLLLISPQGEELAIKDMVRLAGPRFTIKNVQVGEGFHWSRQETRSYRGEMEFRITADGKVTAINVMSLEEYLMGVVPGEMAPNFPLEALKAQAIAARTFFLYNFGRVHQSDPYDVCADVHCQAYIGDKNLTDRVKKAVAETRGVVLELNGELCQTPYSAVCGGHTEHSENVWSGGSYPYLRGIFDLAERTKVEERFDLSTEDNARRWIEAEPDVFCNTEKSGSPTYAEYAQKFFRWEEHFARQELEQQLEKATGRTFGSLLDLQPISRGVSGRLIELRVVGTTDTVTITKELPIRKSLSPKTLYSACFVVDKIGVNAPPDSFVLKGAGWGHGVGMCQIGAAMMAERGKDAREILTHYYSGVKLVVRY